jgi:flagellar motor switch protein FliM
MADILSQSEIDALIAAMVNQGSESEVMKPAPGEKSSPKRIRQYDFRRPDKFSKEQIRTIQIIHENYIRPLQTYFTARFRTMVQMVVGSVDQNTYTEYVRGLSNPSVICPFKIEGLPGTCVIDISPVLAFPMIDRLFGGPGAALTPSRPLTEIETSVISSVLRGMLEAYADSWKSIGNWTITPGNIETNPLFVQVAAPNEIVITVALDVRIGEHVGVITICLPHLTLEPILDRLSAHNWFKTGVREVRAGDQSALNATVQGARVSLVAELGRAELTVGEILELGKGDVIVLGTKVNETVTVYVGNQPKFLGRPGRVRDRIALEIVGDAQKEEEADA